MASSSERLRAATGQARVSCRCARGGLISCPLCDLGDFTGRGERAMSSATREAPSREAEGDAKIIACWRTPGAAPPRAGYTAPIPQKGSLLAVLPASRL